MTDLTNSNSDFDLEYRDVVRDPSNPEMAQISSEIPERYKNKSNDDLVQMHINLEKVLRRQGNEVGQLRKLTDAQAQLLAQQPSITAPRPAEPTKTREPITAESLLSNPEQAINQAVAPAMAPVQSRVDRLELGLAQRDFQTKYPTYQQDVTAPEFQEWVLGSPVRSNLLIKLNSYDFGAGKELWDLWGEHQTAVKAAKTARGERVTAATVMKNSANEPVGKPIYSRAKLAELQMRVLNGDMAAAARWNDPEFQREYTAAYAEDRVK
jgi:hypothetical protein